MATLRLLTPGLSPTVYPIQVPSCLLGRKTDCHIWSPFEGNEGVSRHHARIDKVGDHFLLVDLESRNGTRVNRKNVTQTTVLHDEDVVSICNVDFRFSSAPGDSSSHWTLTEWSHQLTEHDSTYIQSRMEVQRGDLSDGYSETSTAARLVSLLEMLASLGKTLELDDVLSGLLAEVLKIVSHSDTCVIGIRAEGQVDFEVVSAVSRHSSPFPISLSKTIIEEVVRSNQAVLYSSALQDPRLSESGSVRESKMQSVMCVPLVDRDGQLVGVVQVDTHHPSARFRAIDLDVLVGIAPVILVAIRYSQLYKRLLVQRSHEQELASAHNVQRSLLPRQAPAIPGYDFFAFYDAALQVGGDYYDYISLPDGRLAVVVADASGKGTAAALYITSVSGELKYRLAAERSSAEAMQQINRYLCENKAEPRIVTMVLLILDPRTHEVTIFNAGHFSPLRRSAVGHVEEIGAENRELPLGVLPDQKYQESKIVLAPGEWLIMFTDGFTDAENDLGKRYGSQRLRELIGAKSETLTELGRQIVREVRDFMGRKPQSDDMCLVLFGRGKPE